MEEGALDGLFPVAKGLQDVIILAIRLLHFQQQTILILHVGIELAKWVDVSLSLLLKHVLCRIHLDDDRLVSGVETRDIVACVTSTTLWSV